MKRVHTQEEGTHIQRRRIHTGRGYTHRRKVHNEEGTQEEGTHIHKEEGTHIDKEEGTHKDTGGGHTHVGGARVPLPCVLFLSLSPSLSLKCVHTYIPS